MKDLVIIGGGPAGVAAGVYAARKRLTTTLITENFGGQSIVSDGIENWIGSISVPGPELAKQLEAHVRAYAGDVVEITTNKRVEKITKNGDTFETTLNDGTIIESKAVLIASGSRRRKLPVPGADTFEHKGLTYCASCDGPVFADQDVVVVGGGNAGFESAAQLLAYCKSVTLLHRGPSFKADPITVSEVTKHPNMKAILNAEPTEVHGETFVTGLSYKDKTTEEIHKLDVTGIFVEIGAIPNTDYAKDIIELNEFNAVKVDPRNQRTNTLGIWAAGDCTDGLYHQNNIAAGDAVKALEDIYIWLKGGK